MSSPLGPARRRAALVAAAVAGAALLVDLGHFHRLEHGDSLVPVLVSLQRWTPFYWDQERFGMLVPLLAIPVRDPFANLLLQRGLMAFAGLAAIVLLARHVLAGREWPVAGALAAAAVVGLAPAPWAFEYLGNQPYGLSLALALAGLAVAEPAADRGRTRARIAAGLLLVVAAHWVNAAIGVFLLLLAAARSFLDLAEGDAPVAVASRFAVDAGLLVAGLAAGHLFLRLYPIFAHAPLRLALGMLPVREWPGAWRALLGNAWTDAGPAWRWGMAALAAAGAALLSLRGLRPVLRPALARAAVLAGAALAYALFAGTLRWVAENSFHSRYLAPSAVLLAVAATSLLAAAVARIRGAPRRALAVAVALVPAAALVAYGRPSPAGVRADLDALATGGPPGSADRGPALAARTRDVLQAGCNLVAGDYWSVWPTVFHATLVARERGMGRRFWGITHRSNPTLAQWKGLPGGALRICVPTDEDRQAERWLRSYHLWPVREVERFPTVVVLVPAPPLE